MRSYKDSTIFDSEIFWLAVGFVVMSAIIVGAILVYQPFKVWSAELDGKAELAHADAARRILVTQAQAERDAAVLRAEAIGIVGEAAQRYPEYREQEFIGAFAEALQGGKISQIIYVPTEANIPIIEAGGR